MANRKRGLPLIIPPDGMRSTLALELRCECGLRIWFLPDPDRGGYWAQHGSGEARRFIPDHERSLPASVSLDDLRAVAAPIRAWTREVHAYEDVTKPPRRTGRE